MRELRGVKVPSEVIAEALYADAMDTSVRYSDAYLRAADVAVSALYDAGYAITLRVNSTEDAPPYKLERSAPTMMATDLPPPTSPEDDRFVEWGEWKIDGVVQGRLYCLREDMPWSP